MTDKIIMIDEQWDDNLQAVKSLTKDYTKNKEVPALIVTSTSLDTSLTKNSI